MKAIPINDETINQAFNALERERKNKGHALANLGYLNHEPMPAGNGTCIRCGEPMNAPIHEGY
jgi:hypothetical protein